MGNFKDQRLYSKGVEYYKKDQLDISLDFLIKIKKKNLNTLKLISQIYIKKNNIDNAKQALNEILSFDKENLFALNYLGDVNKLEKNYLDAKKFYRKSISCDKNFVPAYFNLASLYEDIGELNLAKNYYLKVTKINNKNYAAYFNLQRLEENLITDQTIKNIYNDLNVNQNFNDKNIAYGHFVLAKNYRKKKEIKMEIKELSKGHKIFFNSEPTNKYAVNYWLKVIPKMMNKKLFFENSNKKKNRKTLNQYLFLVSQDQAQL